MSHPIQHATAPVITSVGITWGWRIDPLARKAEEHACIGEHLCPAALLEAILDERNIQTLRRRINEKTTCSNGHLPDCPHGRAGQ